MPGIEIHIFHFFYIIGSIHDINSHLRCRKAEITVRPTAIKILVCIIGIDFSLKRIIIRAFQNNIDHSSSYMIFGRRTVHDFRLFHPIQRSIAQKSLKLSGVHCCRFSIQDDRQISRTCQSECDFSLFYTGEFSQSLVCIVHHPVAGKNGQIISQTPFFHLHKRTLRFYHDLIQSIILRIKLNDTDISTLSLDFLSPVQEMLHDQTVFFRLAIQHKSSVYI